MHRIHNAVVQGGKLVLSDLPFPDGQHVEIIVAELDEVVPGRASIEQVRRALRGGVERYDESFEPMIPPDAWKLWT